VLDAADGVEVERVDAVVDGDELSMELAEELQALAPFGRGNPGVSLLVADATFADATPMGEGKHVRFTVRSRGANARAVAFGNGGCLPVRDGVPVQATFTLEVNEYNGVSEPRLVLRRARPAVQAPDCGLAGAPAKVAGAHDTAPEPVAAPPVSSDMRDVELATEQPAELVLFALP
jgi:single-stranded-DNA-specific exonuclease